MIERIYKCDLCGDKYPNERLIPIYWASSAPTFRRATHAEAINCEHHLCINCVNSVAALNTEGFL